MPDPLLEHPGMPKKGLQRGGRGPRAPGTGFNLWLSQIPLGSFEQTHLEHGSTFASPCTTHKRVTTLAHSPCRPLTETSVSELHTTDLTSYNLHWECTTPSSHLTPPRLRTSQLTSQTSHRSPCISHTWLATRLPFQVSPRTAHTSRLSLIPLPMCH